MATRLNRHPGNRPIEFVDATGYRRVADLHDLIACQWFAGLPIGPPVAVQRMVHPGDWTIDVGANIGVVTGQLAARVGSSGTVWAIEPVPGNCEQLRDLSERNDLKAIRTFEVAAGARDGSVVLRLPPPGNSAVASVTASWINGAKSQSPCGRWTASPPNTGATADSR